VRPRNWAVHCTTNYGICVTWLIGMFREPNASALSVGVLINKSNRPRNKLLGPLIGPHCSGSSVSLEDSPQVSKQQPVCTVSSLFCMHLCPSAHQTKPVFQFMFHSVGYEAFVLKVDKMLVHRFTQMLF
jgi:hypothetical protein